MICKSVYRANHSSMTNSEEGKVMNLNMFSTTNYELFCHTLLVTFHVIL